MTNADFFSRKDAKNAKVDPRQFLTTDYTDDGGDSNLGVVARRDAENAEVFTRMFCHRC